MGMPAVDTFHTRDMVLALPDDGQRYETVHGELVVSPAPSLRHQEILRRLFRLVDAYVERTGVGRAMFSPADISWGPDVLVQPDLFVIAPADLGARDWTEVKRLALVVEIASPRPCVRIGSPSAASIRKPACRHTGSWIRMRRRWKSGRPTRSSRRWSMRA